jgi:thiosulfate/3-mercaptopyruvate sulfurtransferase
MTEHDPRSANSIEAGNAAWHQDIPGTPAGGYEHYGTPLWQRPLHHVKAGTLDSDTGQTKGMKRFEALSHRHGGTEKLWLGENHVGPEMKSGDHHHGEAETGIYVVSGHPVFVFLENGQEKRIETGPGDYVFVPPYVAHREENPNLETAVVVLARSTQEGIVVNLSSLDGPVGIPSNDVLIEPLGLHQRLLGDRPPAVLDVRWMLGDPDGRLHYEQAHIPSAVYVDLDTELAAAPSAAEGRHPLPDISTLQVSARGWGLKRDQAVVVYDDNSGMSAARAWWLLRWAGVEDVRILDGAFGAWNRTRLPVESGLNVVPAGDVVLQEGNLPVLNADQAAELVDSGVLLDARAGARYRGEYEPIDPRAGHIPGALSAPTAENVAADGRFLAPADLLARFAELGVDGESIVGVYCGSGVTAAHEVAALRIAGVEAALFAGSWSVWSSDPDRPVAAGEHP